MPGGVIEGLLGLFNVMDYGARGDGQTNDTPRIHDAILALPPAGGTVVFPPGNYYLATSVTFQGRTNVTLWQLAGVSFSGPGGLPAGAGSNRVLDMSGVSGAFPPSGPAGGALSGNYPNPNIAAPPAPTTSAVGDAAGAGAATTPSAADHRHGREAFGAAPVVQAFGDAAAAGAAATPARSDHRHGMPGDGSVGSRQVNLTKATADVAASETTTSTSYGDLTTVGPFVTLTPGVAQTHFVTVVAYINNSLGGANGSIMSPSIAGAAPSDADGAANYNTGYARGGASVLAPAVASGATHTAKYKATGGTAAFVTRRITAVAI